MTEPAEPLPTKALLGSLPGELKLLVVQTLKLAQSEFHAATGELYAAALGLAASALAALFGALTLVSAVVLIAIALGAPPWAAALGVGVVLLAGGGAAGWTYFKRLRQAPFGLPDTRSSLAETVTWLKSEVKR